MGDEPRKSASVATQRARPFAGAWHGEKLSASSCTARLGGVSGRPCKRGAVGEDAGRTEAQPHLASPSIVTMPVAPFSELKHSSSSTVTLLTTVAVQSLREVGVSSCKVSSEGGKERERGTHAPEQASTSHEAVKVLVLRSSAELQMAWPAADDGQSSNSARLSCSTREEEEDGRQRRSTNKGDDASLADRPRGRATCPGRTETQPQ